MDKIKKLLNEKNRINAKFNSRRHFLKDCTLGIGGIALGSILSSCFSDNKKIKIIKSHNPLNPLSPSPSCLLYTSPSPRDG